MLILFTPNYATIVPGVACVLSINLGVFGLLYYWNIDLDPISMATTLMAIGFSVDFVAHISFHYYKGEIEVGGGGLLDATSARILRIVASVCDTRFFRSRGQCN